MIVSMTEMAMRSLTSESLMPGAATIIAQPLSLLGWTNVSPRAATLRAANCGTSLSPPGMPEKSRVICARATAGSNLP